MVVLATAGIVTSCATITKDDAFPVPGKAFSVPALQALAGSDGVVTPLAVAGGHPLTAYAVRHPGARGVLLVCGGSGNQVDVAIKGFTRRAAAAGLDLVVFSYFQAGQPVPSVADVRAGVRAVYAATRGMGTPAAASVYVLGHSSGGWFAMDLAAGEPVTGLILAGAETTPADVIRHTYAPWANLVPIVADADAAQLDASRYAPRVRAPTLVVTSTGDRDVPAAVGREVFALLPADAPKRLVVLDGVAHGGYFVSDAFWRAASDLVDRHTGGLTSAAHLTP